MSNIYQNGNKIIELIGKSMKSDEVQGMLQYFGYTAPEQDAYAGSIYGQELRIKFLARLSFDATYLDPPYRFESDDYVEMPFRDPNLPQLEFIVSEIGFDKNFKGTLPFGLEWEDNFEKIKNLENQIENILIQKKTA